MSGLVGKHPTFIVGPGRSGTTFLFRILNEHPKIALTNEAHLPLFLTYCVELGKSRDQRAPKLVTEGGEFEVMCPVNPRYLNSLLDIFITHARQMITEFYEHWFEGIEFTHWGDKMPSAQAGQIELMRSAFPWARYIALFRDPRDYIASHRAAAATRPGFASSELDDLIRHWHAQAELWIDAPRTLLLRYEDLIARPHQVAAQAFEFLGLGMNPACDALIDAREAVREASATTASAADSLERWRHDLSPEEVERVLDTCRPLMERLGYSALPE